jgi:type II secretory pathway pseudopilin PulG
MRRVHGQRGLTYLGVLFAVALLSIGLVAASEIWSTTARRQRLEQLEWTGRQYQQAIGSYYESSPGRAKVFPTTLDDLLEDRRVPYKRRHIRQLYVNPMTGKFDWELIQAPGAGIRGVRVSAGEGWTRDFTWPNSNHLGITAPPRDP